MNDSVRAFVDWSGEFEELYKFNKQWPQSKEWIGLSDEEMNELVHRFARYELIRVVEAKLKEKNV